MTEISRFEANLLRIVHGILQRAPLEKVMPIMAARLERPACLSRPAVELVQDTLAKGAVVLLAREGWRRDRFLRGGQVRSGRLWDRSLPEELGLTFSEHALGFLIWLTAWDRADKQPFPGPPANHLAGGDQLLSFWTYRFLRNTEYGPVLRKCPVIAANGLCRLMFAEDFAGSPTPSWDFWTAGIGSCILECFQIPLTKRWVDMELVKGRISDASKMIETAQGQESTLPGFLEAMNSAGRRDLARFVPAAWAVLLADSPTAQRWIGGLKTDKLRMEQRLQAYRSALAFLRQTERLQAWDHQARTVGYFDDGYAASQLCKADWEKHQGDELCRRAQIILREVEPI